VLLDRRDGLAELARRELRECTRHLGGQTVASSGDKPVRRALRRAANAASAATPRRRLDAEAARPGTPAGATDPRRRSGRDTESQATSDPYLAAWKRIAPVIDRLGDELLRRLLPRQRLRWITGHPSGPRLDLRQAVRCEADPEVYRSLWSRPILPQRRDPALLLLVDHSGSMNHGERIARAFEGLVLMVEVCRRIGVPVAVWSFALRGREELGWDTPLDVTTRERLGRLPRSCDGGTRMAPALDLVRHAFGRRHGDPKLLFVLSDGEPDNPPATRAAIRRLEADGVGTIGLGLGAATAGLARYFERVVTGIPPARLVEHVGGLLDAALMHAHGA
jgi:uncharacterized protein YegL